MTDAQSKPYSIVERIYINVFSALKSFKDKSKPPIGPAVLICQNESDKISSETLRNSFYHDYRRSEELQSPRELLQKSTILFITAGSSCVILS